MKFVRSNGGLIWASISEVVITKSSFAFELLSTVAFLLVTDVACVLSDDAWLEVSSSFTVETVLLIFISVWVAESAPPVTEWLSIFSCFESSWSAATDGAGLSFEDTVCATCKEGSKLNNTISRVISLFSLTDDIEVFNLSFNWWNRLLSDVQVVVIWAVIWSKSVLNCISWNCKWI